jgi:hypothetical protein
MERLERVYRKYHTTATTVRGGDNDMYWVTGILGLALVLAPFVFGYADNTAATWTSLILGGGTIIISFFEKLANNHDRWEYWVAMAAGVVAVIAPFVLGFGGWTVAMVATVAVGILLAAVAGTKLYYGRTSFR